MSIFSRLFGKRQDPGPRATLGELGVDMHSHVIPGIDDGAPAMAQSIEMLQAFASLGYRKVITTPHVMSDGYRNSPETILKGLENVRAAAIDAGIDLQIEAAAEYYLDEVFVANLHRTLLSFGGEKRYVLFETSYVTRPMALEETIFNLQTHGYTPVLAHPERYQYWWGRKDALEEIQELHDRGAKLQVNVSSFAGRHSKQSATIARTLAKQGLIDFLGTDMHRAAQGDTLAKAAFEHQEIHDLIRGGTLLNHTL
jgi:protein-tyrosine phosphatase